MKRIIYSAAMLLALLSTACGGGNKEASALPQIDVNTNYPEKEICLQDVAEVSYVPLETTDEFLLADVASMEMVSSEGIMCVSDEKVLLFHPDGKVKSLLDKKGEGPGEYRYVHYATADWERKEIYIHDIHQKAMMVYSMDGKFKHSFDIDIQARQNDLLCDNEGHIVLYKEKAGRPVHGKIEPPYRPVVWMSKEDGQIDSLSHRQDYYTTMGVKAELADGNAWTLDVPIPALVKLNGEVYVSEVASDTIYRLEKSMPDPWQPGGGHHDPPPTGFRPVPGHPLWKKRAAGPGDLIAGRGGASPLPDPHPGPPSPLWLLAHHRGQGRASLRLWF